MAFQNRSTSSSSSLEMTKARHRDSIQLIFCSSSSSSRWFTRGNPSDTDGSVKQTFKHHTRLQMVATRFQSSGDARKTCLWWRTWRTMIVDWRRERSVLIRGRTLTVDRIDTRVLGIVEVRFRSDNSQLRRTGVTDTNGDGVQMVGVRLQCIRGSTPRFVLATSMVETETQTQQDNDQAQTENGACKRSVRFDRERRRPYRWESESNPRNSRRPRHPWALREIWSRSRFRWWSTVSPVDSSFRYPLRIRAPRLAESEEVHKEVIHHHCWCRNIEDRTDRWTQVLDDLPVTGKPNDADRSRNRLGRWSGSLWRAPTRLSFGSSHASHSDCHPARSAIEALFDRRCSLADLEIPSSWTSSVVSLRCDCRGERGERSVPNRHRNLLASEGRRTYRWYSRPGARWQGQGDQVIEIQCWNLVHRRHSSRHSDIDRRRWRTTRVLHAKRGSTIRSSAKENYLQCSSDATRVELIAFSLAKALSRWSDGPSQTISALGLASTRHSVTISRSSTIAIFLSVFKMKGGSRGDGTIGIFHEDHRRHSHCTATSVETTELAS